jgi:hypothetical protein
MSEKSNQNPTGKIAVIADEKHLFLIIKEFIQTLKDKIDANVTQQGPVVKFGTDFYNEPLVTVIDPDTVPYEENTVDESRVGVVLVDPSLFSFTDGANETLDNMVDRVIRGATKLLRITANRLAAGFKVATADATHEQQQQQSSDQKSELPREEAESIVNIIKDFFKYYQEYYKKGAGKKRSSSNILKTSSSRRGRRSSKKRATKRKQKRRQRRASRRAY